MRKAKKTLIFIGGWVALILGVIGLLLPIMPTTPFIILAAMCFSISSPRFYNRLRKLPYFGAYVENYKTKQGVPLKNKILMLIFLWTGISVSAILIAKTWSTVLLTLVGIGVTIHILCLKTRKTTQNDGSNNIVNHK